LRHHSTVRIVNLCGIISRYNAALFFFEVWSWRRRTGDERPRCRSWRAVSNSASNSLVCWGTRQCILRICARCSVVICIFIQCTKIYSDVQAPSSHDHNGVACVWHLCNSTWRRTRWPLPLSRSSNQKLPSGQNVCCVWGCGCNLPSIMCAPQIFVRTTPLRPYNTCVFLCVVYGRARTCPPIYIAYMHVHTHVLYRSHVWCRMFIVVMRTLRTRHIWTVM